MFIFHLKCDFFFASFISFSSNILFWLWDSFLNTHWMVFSCFGLFDEKIFFHYISFSFVSLVVLHEQTTWMLYVDSFLWKKLKEKKNNVETRQRSLDFAFFGKCLFYELINIFAFFSAIFSYYAFFCHTVKLIAFVCNDAKNGGFFLENWCSCGRGKFFSICLINKLSSLKRKWQRKVQDCSRDGKKLYVFMISWWKLCLLNLKIWN